MRAPTRPLCAALALSAATFAPASAHTAYEIKEILRDWGFHRVIILDAQLPKYQFEACQRGDRYHLHADYYGTITEKYQVGRCDGEGRRYSDQPRYREEGRYNRYERNHY